MGAGKRWSLQVLGHSKKLRLLFFVYMMCMHMCVTCMCVQVHMYVHAYESQS